MCLLWGRPPRSFHCFLPGFRYRVFFSFRFFFGLWWMVDPLAIITCRPVTCCGATNCPKRFSCFPFLSVFLYSRHLLPFASFFFFFFFFFIFFFIFFCVFFLNDFPCLFFSRFSWLNVFQIWLNRFRGGEKNRSARQTLVTRDVRNFSFRYFSENCLKKRSTSIFPSEEFDSFISIFSFCKKKRVTREKDVDFSFAPRVEVFGFLPEIAFVASSWRVEVGTLEPGTRRQVFFLI